MSGYNNIPIDLIAFSDHINQLNGSCNGRKCTVTVRYKSDSLWSCADSAELADNAKCRSFATV